MEEVRDAGNKGVKEGRRNCFGLRPRNPLGSCKTLGKSFRKQR
jgi:hypothetical protein